MSKKRTALGPPSLTIDYGVLGLISLDELQRAIWTDLQVLKEIYHVRYVRAPKLKLPLTNEFGEAINLRHPAGGSPIYRMMTRHFRAACKDYDL